MKNETYSEMVSRLKKPGADVLNDMDAFKAGLMHMALGIVGEYGEVKDAYEKFHSGRKYYVGYSVDPNIQPLIKELGDLEFYLEGLSQLIRRPRNRVCYSAQDTAATEVFSIAEAVKKHVVNGSPLNVSDLEDRIERVDSRMTNIRAELGVKLSYILSRNMDKLDARYASGVYTREQAINRSDEKC